MKCPYCGHSETQVVETRIAEDASTIRRRRQCAGCEKRFTTYERTEIHLPAIVKKDGRRTDYSADKLRASFSLALRKRPVPTAAIDGAIECIEERIRNQSARELPSSQIGEWVMQELEKLDKVAYIRFASVYRSFTDVGDFTALVDQFNE
jgi:transcriptional repressor NrdR